MSERLNERLDERLRRAARTYRRLGNHTAEGMFLEAADTICELQAENAKLQNDADLLRAMLSQERLEKQCYMAENAELQETLQRRTEQFEGMAEMWVVRGVENFKLRELVRHMHTCMEHYEMDGTISCDRCPLDNDTGNCDFERRMSELGVEVD